MQQQEKQGIPLNQTDTEILLQRMASLEVCDMYQCVTPKPHPRSTTARQRPLGLVDTSHRPSSRSQGCRFPMIYNDVHKQRFDRGCGIQGKHIGPISLRHPKLPEYINNSGQSSPEQQDEVKGQSQPDIKRPNSIQTFGSHLSYSETPRNCDTVTPGVIELFHTTIDIENEIKRVNSHCDTSRSQPEISFPDNLWSQPDMSRSQIDSSVLQSDNLRSQTDKCISNSQLETTNFQQDISRSQPEDTSRSQLDDSRSQLDISRSSTGGEFHVND